MKKYFCILILFGLLYSCATMVVKSINTLAERSFIFHEKYFFSPDTSIIIGNEKILFLKKFEPKMYSEEDTFKLYIFEKLENEWQVVKDTVFLFGYDYTIYEPEMVFIDGKQFLYYKQYQSGGSMGNYDLEFTLYDISSLEKYFIHYTELPENGKLLKDFKSSENLISNQNLCNYLEGKLKNSLTKEKANY